jgi:hypothetical protein
MGLEIPSLTRRRESLTGPAATVGPAHTVRTDPMPRTGPSAHPALRGVKTTLSRVMALLLFGPHLHGGERMPAWLPVPAEEIGALPDHQDYAFGDGRGGYPADPAGHCRTCHGGVCRRH